MTIEELDQIAKTPFARRMQSSITRSTCAWAPAA